jgi:hypothetical protein
LPRYSFCSRSNTCCRREEGRRALCLRQYDYTMPRVQRHTCAVGGAFINACVYMLTARNDIGVTNTVSGEVNVTTKVVHIPAMLSARVWLRKTVSANLQQIGSDSLTSAYSATVHKHRQ